MHVDWEEVSIAFVASTYATIVLLGEHFLPFDLSTVLRSSIVAWIATGFVFSGWALAALYRFRKMPGFVSGVRMAMWIWAALIAQDIAAASVIPRYPTWIADLRYIWKGTATEVAATIALLGTLGIITDKLWTGRRV